MTGHGSPRGHPTTVPARSRVEPAVADEVDAEIEAHLTMRAAELVARGMTPEAAQTKHADSSVMSLPPEAPSSRSTKSTSRTRGAETGGADSDRMSATGSVCCGRARPSRRSQL